jgi:hypothetical protein
MFILTFILRQVPNSIAGVSMNRFQLLINKSFSPQSYPSQDLCVFSSSNYSLILAQVLCLLLTITQFNQLFSKIS